jgi:hypothetical protein
MEVNINNVNVVELVNLDISLMAIEDKIIVLHDNYKSGYECEDCNETGFVTCTSCDGSGLNRFDSNCTTCEGKKQLVCPVCKGQKLIIEIPQSARTLPTTGVVVSMGPECHAMKITKAISNAKLIIEMYHKFKSITEAKEEEKIQNKNISNWTKDLEETPIRLGSRVIFGPHVGTFLPMKGNVKLKIMRVTEPLAVIFGKGCESKDFIDFESNNY